MATPRRFKASAYQIAILRRTTTETKAATVYRQLPGLRLIVTFKRDCTRLIEHGYLSSYKDSTKGKISTDANHDTPQITTRLKITRKGLLALQYWSY